MIKSFTIFIGLVLMAAHSANAECHTFDEWIDMGENATVIECIELLDGQQSTTIPSQIGTLTNLKALVLKWENGVVGSFPATLSLLTNLKRIFIAHNGMTGVFPDLSALTKLMRLKMKDLPLTPGPIPDLSALTNLEVIILKDVNLTQTLPKSLEALTKVRTLDFGYNDLSGTIPDSIVALPDLEKLYLPDNLLSGTLPSALVRPSLTVLDIASNQLSGYIQSYPFEDVIYEKLFLSGNRFIDSPANIGANETDLLERAVLSEAPGDFFSDGESCASNTTMCSSGALSCGDVTDVCCSAVYSSPNVRDICETGICEDRTGACLNSTMAPTETPTPNLSVGRTIAPTSSSSEGISTVALAVGIGAAIAFVLAALVIALRARSPAPQWENFRGGAQEREIENEPFRRQNKWFQGSMRQPFPISGRFTPRMPWTPNSEPTQKLSTIGSVNDSGNGSFGGDQGNGSMYKASFSADNPESDDGIRGRGISKMASSSVTARGLNDEKGEGGGSQGGGSINGFSQRRKPSKAPRRSVMESFGASRANITSSIRGVWLNGTQSRSNRKKSFGSL